MTSRLSPALAALAAATFLGAASYSSAFAQTSSPATGTPPQTQAPAATTPAPVARQAARTRPDRVEARIKQLHDQLHITPAEEDKWNAVAQAMRDNAAQMRTLIEQRQHAKNMTAVEDLTTYEQIADAHADGLKKLVPAFQALYDAMSPAQKKTADAVFARGPTTRTTRRAPHTSAGHS